MKQYIVEGMSCAACSARVEKAVGKVPGVTACSVSLLTNSMGIKGDADEKDIISAVEAAGYGARKKEEIQKNKPTSKVDELKDTTTPPIAKRLIWSLLFLLILMYFSMGHMMWNWPVPSFYQENHIAMGLTQALLTIIIMVINQNFFISGIKGLLRGAPNMDTLVALGAGAAFAYSTVALFAMTKAQVEEDHQGVMGYMHEFYFESAAMILTLITLGKMLESYSKGRTTDALKGLMKLAPKQATIEIGKEKKIVAVHEVKVGDVFLVNPGEQIPVDGIIISGESALNEAALTGESIPKDKSKGDIVYAATLNQSGYLKCEAKKVGQDTSLAQIIQMVSDAAATKAPIAKVADKVSGIFVPVVIGIAFVTFLVWLFVGETVGYSLARGISVLVISCPCALGLATPVAIMVGNGIGAKKGILFKTAASLEEAGKTTVVVMDKTGTITKGEPQVTDIILAGAKNEQEILTLASALEEKSEHPLGKAILSYSREKGIEAEEIQEFTSLSGKGLKGCYEKEIIYGGKAELIKDVCNIEEGYLEQGKSFGNQGKTPLYFAKENCFLGMIVVADVIKEDSAKAVQTLQKMGIKVVMLTGDQKETANAIGKKTHVDDVIAEVMPDGKEEVIRSLQKEHHVMMVGDGINDAPALTRANVGIAIGAGTDIAIDAADVVLIKNQLQDVPYAIGLSKKVLKNIHENLFWAFFYNVLGIPLAAGLWIPFLHWELNPMFAAAAMSLSSFCVVTNALRLNMLSINHNHKKKERKKMKKLMDISGMMCGHCEARVKKSLEALPQVEEAIVSHEANTAVVTLSEEIEDAVLKKAVEEQDYQVSAITNMR